MATTGRMDLGLLAGDFGLIRAQEIESLDRVNEFNRMKECIALIDCS